MRDGDMKDFGRSMKGWSPHCPLSGRSGHKRSSVDILGRDWPIRTYGAAAFCCNARLRALLYWLRSSDRGKRMKRWEFIALLSGEAAALPLAAALTSMRS